MPGCAREPRRERRGLAVGQQVEHAVTLQVDQHRAVAVALAPRPVVDAEHPDGLRGTVGRGVLSTRSSVSALAPAAMPSSRASRAPASPPSASPISSSALARRVVRRAYATVVAGSRSQKTRRGQSGTAHTKRRTRRRSATVSPCHGRSARRRS